MPYMGKIGLGYPAHSSLSLGSGQHSQKKKKKKHNLNPEQKCLKVPFWAGIPNYMYSSQIERSSLQGDTLPWHRPYFSWAVYPIADTLVTLLCFG